MLQSFDSAGLIRKDPTMSGRVLAIATCSAEVRNGVYVRRVQRVTIFSKLTHRGADQQRISQPHRYYNTNNAI